jgi:hypothetical protein
MRFLEEFWLNTCVNLSFQFVIISLSNVKLENEGVEVPVESADLLTRYVIFGSTPLFTLEQEVPQVRKA